MLKLSAIALAGSSLLAATNTEVESFLKKQIGANPRIKSMDVKTVERRAIKDPAGWDALVLNLTATIKQGSSDKNVSQRMVYFVNGDYLTENLTNIKTGESLKNSIAPKFKAEFYRKSNLIYGDEHAEHKVAIFSDPLCPFCRRFVPEAIKYMIKYPSKFAIYYYHLPLASLHPAAVTLTKAAIAAELEGRRGVVLGMYNVKINSNERDEQKILDAFNKTLGTKITKKEIHSDAVKEHSAFDMNVVQTMMVHGTPTMFFDGKIDKTKSKYKAVKVK